MRLSNLQKSSVEIPRQRRGIHTSSRISMQGILDGDEIRRPHISRRASTNTLGILRNHGVPVSIQRPCSNSLNLGIRVTLTFDRSLYLPMIQVLRTTLESDLDHILGTFQLPMDGAVDDGVTDLLVEYLDCNDQRQRVVAVLEGMRRMFYELKLRYIGALIIYDENGDIVVADSNIVLDDAALKTDAAKYELVAKAIAEDRGANHARDSKEEAEAAKHGIVFLK